MWAELLRHPATLLFSIVGHLLVLTVLVFGLHRAPVPLRQPASATPIKAIAVDEQQVRDALQKLEQAEQREQQDREQAKRALEQQLAARKQEEQRVAELKRQATEEAHKRQAETERLAKTKQEQAKVEQQQRAEQQRLAALETKRKAEEEARQQAAAKREAEEQARKQAAEEARTKAAAEAQRKKTEAAARKKAEAEARRKAELAAALDREEDERRLAQERRRLQSLRAQYEVAIQQRVQRNWLRPPSVTSAMYCDVLVNQIPSGDVTRVEILECEGGSAFQRSVEVAVRKASPLPSPPDPALFDREIQFTFRPEN
jgi:colicin import membrane protein